MHLRVVLIELVSPVHELLMDVGWSGFGCVADHTQRPRYPFHDLLRCLFGSVKIDGEMVEANSDQAVHNHFQSRTFFCDEENFFAVSGQGRYEIGDGLAFAGTRRAVYDRVLACGNTEDRTLLA